MDVVIESGLKILHKMEQIFSTPAGWIVSAGMAAATFLGPEALAFGAVGIAILWDMFWGIVSSIKRGRYGTSVLMKETPLKILIYGGSLLIVLLIERSLNADWGVGTRVLCSIAAVTELWSSTASILIVYPRCPFIRATRFMLKGEIANKLQCKPEEVEDILTK